jgi:hypothetical protein
MRRLYPTGTSAAGTHSSWSEHAGSSRYVRQPRLQCAGRRPHRERRAEAPPIPGWHLAVISPDRGSTVKISKIPAQGGTPTQVASTLGDRRIDDSILRWFSWRFTRDCSSARSSACARKMCIRIRLRLMNATAVAIGRTEERQQQCHHRS